MMNNRTENQTNQGMGVSSWRMAWLGVWALTASLLGLAQPALAANPPAVQTYYVALPENQLLDMFGVIGGSTNATSPIKSNTTIAVLASKTIIYYDHWEDGFETDITNPRQTTTQIWGDGNSANGSVSCVDAALCTGDVISLGAVIRLSNDVATTTSVTVTNPYQYNGRDKFGASKSVSVSRVDWATGSDTLMAQSTLLYDTNFWGTVYRVPVGTNSANSYQMFEYTAVAVMAGKGGATISIDANADGDFADATDVNALKISEGESYLSANTLVQGARIVSSDNPIQVNLLTGDNGSNYESRDGSLLPVASWDKDYVTPVSTSASYDTRVFFYNPNGSQITINWESRVGTAAKTTGSFNVTAGGGNSYTVLPGAAMRFYNASSGNFFAFSTTDSGSITNTDNQTYDWGYPLNPRNKLTPQILAGFALGCENATNCSTVAQRKTGANAPVWVTPIGNGETAVTVYADFNGDGTVDAQQNLKELQQWFIYDTNDGDQSGMRVWVTDPAYRLSGAWGEHTTNIAGGTTAAGLPGFDAGTGIPPAPLFDVGKAVSLIDDKDGDGRVSPGDRIEYEILVNNTGRIPVPDVKLVDTLPADVVYVAGSTNYRFGVSGGYTALTDAGGAFPLTGPNGNTFNGNILVDSSLSVRFRVDVKTQVTISKISELINTVSATAFGFTGTGVNTTPLIRAVDDSYAGRPNVAVFGNAGNQDIYPPGSTFTQLTSPSSGTVSNWNSSTGTFQYTNGTAGTYTFNYQVCMPTSGGPSCSTATETIVIATATTRTLSGTVFIDQNQDKLLNGTPTEAGTNASGVLFVSAIDPLNNQVVDSQPVAANGTYTLTVPQNKTYTLVLTTTRAGSTPALPSGWFRTGESGNTTADPIADGALSVAVATSNVTNRNFGILPPPSLTISKTAGNDVDTQTVRKGNSASFKIVITNTGNITLNNLMLTDALAPGCAGAPSPASLAPGASVTKTCSLENVQSGFTNSATVTAQPVDIGGNPLGGTLTGTDTTPVIVINPSIAIVKTAADGSDSQGVLSGQTANFKIRVTNTGDATLTAIQVTDPLSPDCDRTTAKGNAIASLAAGAFTEYTCSQAGVLTSFTNTANVTGTPPVGTAVTASDTTLVNIVTPGLSIEKTPKNQTVKLGSTVNFTIKVTNTGSAPLTNIVVTDANTPNCNKTIASLAAGANDTYTCALTNVQASFVNTAVATAGALTASDVANVIVIDPKIELTKWTNDFDGKQIRVGTLVTWQYILRNSGDVDLTDIKLSDNKIASNKISCPANTLAKGASMTCYSYGPAAAGAYANTATVTADSPTDNDTVTASDTSSYTGVNPGAIGNTVWLDENGNGQQEAGEAGIPNLNVTLLGAGPNGTFGDGDDTTTNTVTDANGGYLFTNLPAGKFRVTVTPTAGLNATYNEDTGTTTPNNVTEVTLTEGKYHLTADFGYNWVPAGDSANPGAGATGAIGDRVWIDVNGNGLQDEGEAGIGGVSVTLKGPGADGQFGTADDNTVATTTTNAAGNYIFDGLAPGAYAVAVSPATLPSANGQTWTQTGDPDGSGADNRTTDPVVLAPGDVFVNADFGYRPSAGNVIGDTIFFDADADTGQDTDEPGIAGVTVALLNGSGVVIATQTTDATGKYAFSGLPAGTYTVLITDTQGVLRNLQLHADPEHVADPTANPTPDNQTTVTFAGLDGSDLTRDFGYTAIGQHDYNSEIPGLLGAAGTIGDTVFLDRNGNGQAEAGEGLEGVTVNLYLADGTTLVATTQTNANGLYSFGHVNVFATWVVKVDTATLPFGGAGLTNSADPDNTGGDSQSVVSNISATGNINLNQDFGYTPSSGASKATIAGTVWNDTNADGLIINVPQGLGGVTVELREQSTGRVVGVAVTSAAGNYGFDNLPPGTYTVDVTDTANVLEGWWHSLGPASTNAAVDNDSKVEGIAVTVAGGDTNTNIDFGYYNRGTAVGNRAWLDSNGNGIQDPGEVAGVGGVEMTLLITYPTGDTTTMKAVSDATGLYRFGGLLLDESFVSSTAGTPSTDGKPSFRISAGTPPTGYSEVTLYNQGGNIQTDGDNHAGVTTAAIPKGQVSTVIVASDPSQEGINASYDFAYIGAFGISGTVYNDIDGDGDLAERTGEAGIGGVTVTLYTDPNGDGNPIDGAEIGVRVTNGSGGYSFTGLPPGHYVVEETNPTNFSSTADVDLPNDDRIRVSLTNSAITGQDFLDTFGNNLVTQKASISDLVWLDANGDGVPQTNEAGLPGVTLYLCTATPCNAGSAVATTVTDATGKYQFGNLPAGNYYVTVVNPYPDPNTGLLPSTYAGATTTTLITLNPTQNYPDADFGFKSDTSGPGEIALGDRVWFDVDGDGLQDAGEGGIGGVKIKIINRTSGATIEVVTKADGSWLATGLPAVVSYAVTVDKSTLPGNLVSTPTNMRGGDTYVTDPLPAGTINTSLDFGYKGGQAASIGDAVWLDSNNDGLRDVGEAGLSGVTLKLYAAGLDGTIGTADDQFVAATTTDVNGAYLFSGLVPGQYQVKLSGLPGTSGGLAATNLSTVAGQNANGYQTGAIALAAGQFYQTADFGYQSNAAKAVIGDRIWHDTNGDGVQDAGEAGIGGVTVRLCTDAGCNTVIATTTTRPDGSYLFTNRDPGSYTVSVDTATLPGAGAGYTNTGDPDATLDGKTSVTVVAGQEWVTADFGYRNSSATGSIGDTVYDDLNGDGNLNGSDAGIPGVTLKLIEAGPDGNLGTADDRQVATTTTDASGNYVFSGLSSGNYRVVVTDQANVLSGKTATQTAPASMNPCSSGCTAITNADFGYATAQTGTGSIGDRVWLDINGDGNQTGESGIANVTVNLIDTATGKILATKTTDASGNYTFNGLKAGSYAVVVTDLNGVLTNLTATTSPATVTLTCPTASTCDMVDTVDFGYKPSNSGGTASLGGTIWTDQISGTTGVLDASDPLMPGVTVELLSADGSTLLSSTVTDANGNYLFLGLAAGTYQVRVAVTNPVLTGMLLTTSSSPTLDNNSHVSPYAVTLADGATDTTVDFGYAYTGGSYTVSGVVYEDNGGKGTLGTYDGIAIDPIANRATVSLYRNVGGTWYLVSTTKTAGTGTYIFTGLPAGDYRISVNTAGSMVEGMIQTGDPDSPSSARCDTSPAICDNQYAFSLTADRSNLNFGYWNGGVVTTPVSLSWFRSRLEGDEVRVDFATVTEAGNQGFEVYVERAGDLVRVGDYIPSKVTDSVEPQFYRVRVPYQAGDRQYYLRDIDVHDHGTDHGPYALNETQGSKPVVKTIDWKRKGAEKQARERLRFNQARAASRKAAALGLMRTQAAGDAPADLAVFRISQAGPHRVTDADLKAAGIDLGVTDTNTLRLLDAAGRNVPVRFEGLASGSTLWRAGAALSFLGQPRANSLHGTVNAYRLRGGRTFESRITDLAASPPSSGVFATHHLDSVTLAAQKLYSFSAPNGDPWYQQRLVNSATAYSVPLSLPGLVAGVGGARVDLDVWGGTGAAHRVLAKVNGGAEADLAFDGITARSAALDASQLVAGANTLSLKVPGDRSATGKDLVNLEGVRITYPRNFVAGPQGLRFTAAGDKFQVTGLPSATVAVFRERNGVVGYLLGVRVVKAADGTYTASFAGIKSSVMTYHVIAGAAAKPKVEPGVVPANCADGDTDYLAIVHPQFDTPLLDGLLNRRSGQGYQVRKVRTDSLYAQYSGGLADPAAIQACVKAAPKLKHLLLVGSDTYDPNNHLGIGSLSFVPTVYTQTDDIVRYAPCDTCYGMVDGQLKVAVGRLLARDNQELARLLTQTETFESKSYARKLVQAADAYDSAQQLDFKADAQAMNNLLPAGWQVQSVFLDDYKSGTGYDVTSARAALKAGIESGAAMTSYIGHSSQGQWSFNKLFSLADALALDVKGQPTLLTQWGCWNTYFVAPKFDTLAHGFLLGGGKPGAAAAVLGASVLAESRQESALSRKLALSLSEPGISLGEAVLKAKQALLAERPQYTSIVQSWTLLGDPGLVVEK